VSAQDAEKLNWTREEAIALPAPEKEGRLAIRRSDWQRIKRCIRRGEQPLSNLPTWYSVCFSVAASAAVSIIPIAAASGLPAWVTPSYVVVTVGAVVLGIVLVLIERRLASNRATAMTELREDIDEIEKSFERGEPPTA